MLVLPLHRQGPDLSAQDTEAYLKHIHVNPVDLHMLNDRQNLQTCADDTALTSQFNIAALQTLLLYLCAQDALSRRPTKRHIMPSRIPAWPSSN